MALVVAPIMYYIRYGSRLDDIMEETLKMKMILMQKYY